MTRREVRQKLAMAKGLYGEGLSPTLVDAIDAVCGSRRTFSPVFTTLAKVGHRRGDLSRRETMAIFDRAIVATGDA